MATLPDLACSRAANAPQLTSHQAWVDTPMLRLTGTFALSSAHLALDLEVGLLCMALAAA